MQEYEFKRKGFWRLDDQKRHRGVMHVSNMADAFDWNDKHWGIFWTVNRLKSNCARIEANLEALEYWHVDIDSGRKKDQLKLLERNLPPSMIIESKNGFHAYWTRKDQTLTKESLEAHKKTLKRLVKIFKGDPNATDLVRILRVPCFMHWKDKDDPYLIRLKSKNDNVYTQKQMDKAFGVERERYKPTKKIETFEGDNIFAKASSIDAMTALERISGTDAVCGETYSFKRTRNKHNIWVDGKTSPCWIDESGLIGSNDKGGPTICQWLYWFHKDWHKVAKYLEKHFPELKEG